MMVTELVCAVVGGLWNIVVVVVGGESVKKSPDGALMLRVAEMRSRWCRGTVNARLFNTEQLQ